MTTPLPRASEIHQTFIDALRTQLGAAADLRPLSRWSNLGYAFAALAARTNQIAVEAFDAHVLDRATGDDLDAYCAARGPVIRQDAAKARGYLTLTRPTAGAGAGTIYAGTEVRIPYASTSYLFVTTQDVAMLSGSLTTEVACEAVESGSASNVGTVSSGVTLTGLPLALFDATIVGSSITVSSGADAESDAEMRERQRLWEQARQRATGAAVAFGALLVSGVRHVVLANVRDPHLGGQGAIYVGDVNWSYTSLLLAEVAATLEGWRGKGCAIAVRGMAQSDVSVTGSVTMAKPVANYDLNTLRTALAQAAIDYFDKRTDPYAYSEAMMSGRVARVNDDIAAVSLTLSPPGPVLSPLSPSSFRTSGMPVVLTRYRTHRSLVTIDVVGPS